eukprot:9495911-Pyramimonas_sp.AAC.2
MGCRQTLQVQGCARIDGCYARLSRLRCAIEKFALSEHESTLTSRNRQSRFVGGMSEGAGGGRQAFAMAATTHRLGLATGKAASGRTK